MNKRYMLILLMLMLVLPIVFAEQQSLGVFKKGECINLRQTCNCTYVNFTSVVYPNSTQLMGNVEAIKTGSIFTYEICNTTEIGMYAVNGVGDVDGDTVFTYSFDVTPTGKQESNSPVSLAVAGFFIIINVGLFMLYFIKSSFHSNKYINFIIKRSILVISIFFTMFDLSIITTLVASGNYELTSQIYGFMEIIGWVGYTGIIVLILSTLFQFLGEMKNDKREQRTGEEYG